MRIVLIFLLPPTTSCDCADQARPAFELCRTDFASRCIMREQDLAGSFGWWFLPGTCERPIIRGIGWFVCVFRFESNDQPVLVHNDPSDQLCDGAAIPREHIAGYRPALFGDEVLLQA